MQATQHKTQLSTSIMEYICLDIYNRKTGVILSRPASDYSGTQFLLCVIQYWSLLNWQNLRLHCGCVALPVNWIFDIISSFFAKFINVVHSFEPAFIFSIYLKPVLYMHLPIFFTFFINYRYSVPINMYLKLKAYIRQILYFPTKYRYVAPIIKSISLFEIKPSLKSLSSASESLCK